VAGPVQVQLNWLQFPFIGVKEFSRIHARDPDGGLGRADHEVNGVVAAVISWSELLV
jgi:hypothetical protein